MTSITLSPQSQISIISVVLNRKKSIQTCLESVDNQTYQNIEHIIIDGGSTDGTLSVVDHYVKNSNHTSKMSSERDSGVYDALNKGITLSSGDIIGMLHSDDKFFDNDVISQVMDIFEQHPEVDFVYSDALIVDGERIVRHYNSKIFSKITLRFGFMPAHTTMFIRKEVFQKYGLYRTDFKISADFEYIFRICHKNDINGYYFNAITVIMASGGISSSGINSKIKIFKEKVKIFREYNLNSPILRLAPRYVYIIIEFTIFLFSQIINVNKK